MSSRVIALPAGLIEELHDFIRTEGIVLGSDTVLFVGDNEGLLDYSNWRRRVWLPACEAADLVGMQFHDLRRTSATVLVQRESTPRPRRGGSATLTSGSRWACPRNTQRLLTELRPTFSARRCIARGMLAGSGATGSRGPTRPRHTDQHLSESGCRDLNPGPQRPERCALTKLRYTPL